MPVKYTVKSCAYLNDKVTTAKSECKEIEVFLALTLVSEPKIKVTYTIGKSEQKISFPKYSCQPAGCLLNLDYNLALISKKTDIKFAKNP